MNALLRLLARDFLFIGKNIVSEKLVSEKRVGFYWPKNPFPHIFSNPLLKLERPIFLKKSYLCWWKPFSSIFSNTDSNESSFSIH